MEILKVEDLLESSLFQCKQCKKRLSLPIMHVPDLGSLCGRCFSMDIRTNAKENVDLTNILLKLRVPCSFNADGCFVKRPFSEIAIHEDSCQYKKRICPLALINKCKDTPILAVSEHFKKEHEEYVLQYNLSKIELNLSLKFDFEDFYLLIVNEVDYLLRIKLDNALNSLYFLIYYFEDKANDFLVGYESVNCIIKDVPCNAVPGVMLTPAYDTINGTKFDLTTLRRCFDDVTMATITALVPGYQLENSKLLKCIECCNCDELMNMRIKQCEKGHSLCRKCIQNYRECPICSSSIGNCRNYALESISMFLYYPCTNEGCTQYVIGEQTAHHNLSCRFKQYECPFLIKENCKWKGLHHNLKDHLVAEHAGLTIFSNFIERSITMDYQNHKYDTLCFILGEHIFKTVVCINGSNKLFLSYGIYGPKVSGSKFHWETGIINMQLQKGTFIVKEKCPIYTNRNFKLSIEDYHVRDTIYFYHKIHCLK